MAGQQDFVQFPGGVVQVDGVNCSLTALDNCGIGDGPPNVVRLCANLRVHFFWGLCCVFIGWFQLLSRCVPRLKPWHSLMGLMYMYSMVALMYTSLWSRNDGFTIMIFIFGIVCYGSMLAGHFLITRVYKGQAIAPARVVEDASSDDAGLRQEEGGQDAGDDLAITDEAGGRVPAPGAKARVTTQTASAAASSAVKGGKTHAAFLDERVRFGCWRPTRRHVRNMHGVLMFISVYMTSGAGFFFTRRYLSITECQDILTPRI